MVTDAYWAWDARGRPWELASPIADLYEQARVAGVGRLGTIGSDNIDHLQSDFPEDHCPFSFTEWPVQVGEYVVFACDLADGPHMDRLLVDAKAGRAEWVKYLNFRGRHYSRQNAWFPEQSSDYHGHVSARTDFRYHRLGGYNPFTGATGDSGMSEWGPIGAPPDNGNRTGAVHAADAAGELKYGHSLYDKSKRGWMALRLIEIGDAVKTLLTRPARVEMTEEDRAAIVADLGTMLPTLVEKAVRKVMLDAGTE